MMMMMMMMMMKDITVMVEFENSKLTSQSCATLRFKSNLISNIFVQVPPLKSRT